MKLNIIGLCFIILFSSSGQAFEFKSIEIGGVSTPEKVKNALGHSVNCSDTPAWALHNDDGDIPSYSCSGNTTVAKEPASVFVVIDTESIVKVVEMKLSPDSYDNVNLELIKKYGVPSKINNSIVKNIFGVHFEQSISTWVDKNGNEIFYSKYTSSLDKSYLRFSTRSYRDSIEEKKLGREKDM
ncbi:hypothetical protein [Methylomonas sp. DH-1]|uniref:hypothetical protein n=1 Tax=Methylomonas sp. (strain DH-1) TaxID=1727196 RepID=UPI000A7FC35F|nr:hypothetical protein [Methylomonas sp. DH-1]